MTTILKSNVLLWCSIAFLFALLFLYIFQIGLLNRELYFVKTYQRQLALLLEDTTDLDINLCKKNSLSNIDDYLSGQNFVKSDNIKYIKILESSVAAK